MNLSQFFEHWRIVENPFKGEEARHDSVFARIGFGKSGGSEGAAWRPSSDARPRVIRDEPVGGSGVGGGGGESGGAAAPARDNAVPIPVTTTHSDFDKILGDLGRPSTAIVFGEKGSGKTAIRLQIADRVSAHNDANPEAKVLLVAYDDLNAVLERFHRRIGGKSPHDAFQKFRLVDHIDALLALATPRLIDRLLDKPGAAGAAPTGGGAEAVALDLGPDARKVARRLDSAGKRDLMLLQAVYDRADSADLRTARLRRMLRLSLPASLMIWNILAWFGWVPAAAVFYWARKNVGSGEMGLMTYIFAGLLGLWLIVLAKRFAWDNLALAGIARRIRRQVRISGRTETSLIRSLRQLDPAVRDAAQLPMTDSDEPRYAMLERFRRVLRHFGYVGMLVVVDRVDEPTLVSGDPDRMRAIIWPLFNNKFLQQEGLGIKMLLPIELRHALFKESSAFFQEARLDKQNLIERLSWTGAMLYDICDARLKACRAPGAGPISLLDLFAEDVTARDLVDALDQMHQPRDAFKFLYACLVEHCSNVTSEQEQWRVPRLVVETVKKQQADRVQQLYRGIRPA